MGGYSYELDCPRPASIYICFIYDLKESYSIVSLSRALSMPHHIYTCTSSVPKQALPL